MTKPLLFGLVIFITAQASRSSAQIADPVPTPPAVMRNRVIAPPPMGITNNKIEGAFGMKLGDVFKPEKAAIKKFELPPAYEFTPEKPNSAFSTYLVYITPNSNLIYQIVAVGQSGDQKSRDEMVSRIRAITNQKYVHMNVAGEELAQNSQRTIFVTQIGRESETAEFYFAAFYSDSNLEEMAKEEEKQNAAAALLKDADTTGL